MTKGLLITNAFLRSEKFTELYDMLEKAAEKQDIRLILKTNADFLSVYSEKGSALLTEDNPACIDDIPALPYDFVLFWDKDIRLARAFEASGIPVFNSASSIGLCDDKALTLESLSGLVRIPLTIMAPLTFDKKGYEDTGFLSSAGRLLGYPMIIKECFGSFGAEVFLAKDEKEAAALLKGISYPFILQEYISFSRGRDIRLEVVGNEVIASMLRKNPDDFRANLTNGGRMEAYSPSKEEEELALRVTEILKLDFAGVDILFSEKGPVLCEVNSNAHFKNLFDLTGVNAADHIMSYIKAKLSDKGK